MGTVLLEYSQAQTDLEYFLLCTDIVMGEWQPQQDGSKERNRSYSISLNYSFGPKFCHTTERQV